MVQILNQFDQTAEKGQIALLNIGSKVLSAIIDASETSEDLRTGDPVKLIATSTTIPHVAKCASTSDKVFGFLIFNPLRNGGIKAGDRVEVAVKGTYIYHKAASSISAGQSLQIDITSAADSKVAPWVDAVAAVKANGTLTFAANPTDADTIKIGAQTYRFKTTMAAINDIKLGADLAATLASLAKTINGTGAVGTDYFAGTITPNLEVSAAVADEVVTVTAKEAGVAGNSIALATSSANVTLSAAALAGGTAAVTAKAVAGYALDAASTDGLLRICVGETL